MRGLFACGLLLCVGTPAWAGLYNTSEFEEGTIDPDKFLVFRDTLLQLRSIGMTKVQVDKPLRKRYLLQAQLAGRANPATLTTEQKLNLSAVLIRCKKADEAINLLVPLTRQEPKNFLLLSNLATAYQQAGQVTRAIDYLDQALANWPKHLGDVEEPFRTYLLAIPWHESAFDFYRKAETYQVKLLRLRSREALAKKGNFQTVDALFDDGKKPPGPVRFLADSGKFEPGKLAREEKAKLPKDAIDIVQQLLVWLPEDVRLYWLLGELYNAQGGAKNIKAARMNIKAARMIFDELAGFGGLGVRAEELADHRRELLSYELPDDQITPLEKGIDWRTLGVGFGTGLVVAIFGMWQIREIRRRRQNREVKSRGVA